MCLFIVRRGSVFEIKGRQSGKHLLCEWPIALIIYMYSHQGQTFVAIIPDAFTTGFEEHMSTFSQEVRALDPVRIVVIEIHVAGCGLCQFRML